MADTPHVDARDAAAIASADQVQAQLIAQGVKVVACTFVDLAGVTRVKAVPIEHLAATARYGVGISYVSTVFTVDDQIASSPGFDSPSGDMRLRPDLDAVVVLPDLPGWAWAPVHQDTQGLEPMPACPRHTLATQVAVAADRGLTFRMAMEVEFNLLEADGQPVHGGPGYGARALFDAADFTLELVDVLAAQGMEVQQFHPEYTTSQYEISIAPTAPVRAADRYTLLRATIIRVARRHGCLVSFAPVAMHGEVGNGAHLHLSAWEAGRNLMAGGDGPCGMSTAAASFAAGVLEHLRALSAVLTPSVVSYARLLPTHWSAPFTCWGPENREAAVRYISGSVGTRDRAANIELKPIDGAANPYLALAVVIAAGLDGLDRELSLPEPVTVDPAILTADERSARGIHRLPVDLEKAIDRTASSELARATFGDALFEAFLAVRRLEWATFGGMDMAEVVDAHRWRYG
jgi:glutamine synthetase